MKTHNTLSETTSEPVPSEPKVPASNTSQPIDLTEINGPKGPEPTRFGDWERKGRCVDF